MLMEPLTARFVPSMTQQLRLVRSVGGAAYAPLLAEPAPPGPKGGYHMKFQKAARAVTPLALSAGMIAAGAGVAGASTKTHAGATPVISASSFNLTFSVMAKLKPLVAKGSGKIAAILPDTTTSARYTEFDAPYLKEAFLKAGMPASDFIIQNAQGSDATQYADAQADITQGAKVLLVDPLDSGVGARIEAYAKSHGAAVVDYDRLTLGGSRSYYVSFNNVQVGRLIGHGFVSCVAAWHIKHPNALVMRGAPTDNNATLFAEGYMSVLNPLVKAHKITIVGQPAGTWTPSVAQTEFTQQFTAHKNMNSAVVPNDENAAPIITWLKSQQHIKPKTFPITGQDATLVGLQNILTGYQCGTVYKPIYLEAQAAAALGIYLRAGVTPPKALANGTTMDTQEHKAVPSVLLTPEWVTTKNMKATILKDKFVPAKQLCAGPYAAACKAAGI